MNNALVNPAQICHKYLSRLGYIVPSSKLTRHCTKDTLAGAPSSSTSSSSTRSVPDQPRPDLNSGTNTKTTDSKAGSGSDSPEDGTYSSPDPEVIRSNLRTVTILPGRGRPPEPPTTCCMSGCPNCVWMDYAEQLSQYYRDGGSTALEEIEKIEDPNMKAFLLLEFKFNH